MLVVLEPNKYRDRKNINAKVPPNFEQDLGFNFNLMIKMIGVLEDQWY